MKKIVRGLLGSIVFASCLFLPLAPTASSKPASELRFAVVTDLHINDFEYSRLKREASLKGSNPANIGEAIRYKIRQLLSVIQKNKPDFVVVTGDAVNSLNRMNVFALEEEFKRSGLKVYQVPGNHDRRIIPHPGKKVGLPGEKSSPSVQWRELWGIWSDTGGQPLSAHFEQEGFCFIFLNDSNGRFNEADIKKASDFLDRHPDRRVFIFFHKPLKMPNESQCAIERHGEAYGPPFIPGKFDIFPPSPIFPFIRRYQDRIEAIFAGHLHKQAEDDWGHKFHQIILGAGHETGMYSLVECKDGQKCHYAIRTAWDSNPEKQS